MSEFVEEINALVISLEHPLEENLYYLNEALNNTQYQLIIELKGKAINRNYDTIFSYLLIFYNYINFIKREDPFFEAIIRLPDILSFESILSQIKFEVIFVSEHIKDIQNGRILQYNQENLPVLNEIKRYLQEDVREQVEIILGKREGKYKNLEVQTLRKVILGGTFDHLHYGHKIMLSAALLLAIPANVEIVLGLTGSELLKNKKNKELLQSFDARKNRIEYFQHICAPHTKFYIFELMDPMGPLRDQQFDGVIISHETMQSSLGINKFRKEHGYSELLLIVVDIISQSKSQCGDDFSEKASSTSIRNYLLKKNNLVCDQFEYLYEKWKSIFSNYNCHAQVLNKWFDNIKVKYSEYPRHYHTLAHIYSMLQLSEQYKIEVELSIWFHDVIYNPKRKDNEKRSADYYLEFEKELKMNNIIAGQSKVIVAYILQTANHVSDQINEFIQTDEKLKQDLDLFLDIDLSILGQPEEVYDQYSRDIIKEYSHYSPEQIKTGRSQILTNFLNEKNLFKTKSFQERFAKQTQINIERELSYLLTL